MEVLKVMALDVWNLIGTYVKSYFKSCDSLVREFTSDDYDIGLKFISIVCIIFGIIISFIGTGILVGLGEYLWLAYIIALIPFLFGMHLCINLIYTLCIIIFENLSSVYKRLSIWYTNAEKRVKENKNGN